MVVPSRGLKVPTHLRRRGSASPATSPRASVATALFGGGALGAQPRRAQRR